MSDHWIECEIRYLTTVEGGRSSGVTSDYRGQFYYNGRDWDGVQYFPDDEWVELGRTVRTLVRLRQQMWDQHHCAEIHVGLPVEIREGRKVVGRGVVTRMDVGPPSNYDD